MKRNLRKIFIIFMVFLCVILTNKVYAEKLEVTVPEMTENYKEWLKLSEKEKKKTIEPLAFPIIFNNKSQSYNSSRVSMLNNLKSSLGTSYNLKDEITLKVKNQEKTNRCWAFSLSSVLETTIAKMTKGVTYKYFSPIHMDYWVTNNSNTEFNSGGNSALGFAYYTGGAGPIDDSEELTAYIEANYTKYPDTYINGIKREYQVNKYTRFPTIDKTYQDDGTIKYTDGTTNGEYSNDDITKIRNLVKEHIQKYGAVTSYTYAGTSSFFGGSDFINYYDESNHSYFYKGSTKANHQITIVGWDDTFSKDKFKVTPPSDGAWIVLNSWGDEVLDKGYYYISYYDKWIEYEMIGVNEISDLDYSNIYQYDELGYSGSLQYKTKELHLGNIFDKKENNSNKTEYLTQVSFYLQQMTNVDIYYAKWDKTNKKILGEKQLIKSLKASEISENGFFTYYTYKLNEDEYIKIDDSFTIIIKYYYPDGKEDIINMPLEIYYEGLFDQTNTSWKNVTSNGEGGYFSADGTTWKDINEIEVKSLFVTYHMENADLCIKAFTSYLDNINVKSVSLNIEKSEMNEGDTLQLTAIVSPKTATNKEVTWKSSNEEVAKVDENGKVTAKSAGKATIIVTTKDQAKTASCEITVNEKAKDILVTQIDLNANQKEIYIGDKFKINATITPDNATNKDLTWETEDKTIATVSSDGTVTGVAKGKVTIKVTNKASGKSAVCVVTVLDKKEDEYYKEQEEKISENIDYTDNQENTANNDTEEIQTTDDTTYGAIIPQTGIKAGVKIVLIVIASFGIISFVKFYRRRDI